MEPNFEYRLGSTGAMAIQADSQPIAMSDENGRSGWSYTKISGAEKFNWYIYSGAHENMTVGDVDSLYFVGSIDAWSDATSELPFWNVYTKMKMDGSDAGSWYGSRITYTLHKDSQLVRSNEKCIFYALDQPDDTFSGMRKIPMMSRIVTGVYNPEDEILTVSLGSDSGATQCSVYAETIGMDCSSFGRRVGKNYIKMKLSS
jgi:hypothetical protein